MYRSNILVWVLDNGDTLYVGDKVVGVSYKRRRLKG